VVQREVSSSLILSFRIEFDFGAHEPGQQDIAGVPVAGRSILHSVFELNNRVHTKGSRNRDGRACEIRLNGPGDQDGVSILRQSLTEIIFQLSRFIATEGWPGQIIPLDVQVNFQMFGQFFRPFERRWPGQDVTLWMQ